MSYRVYVTETEEGVLRTEIKDGKDLPVLVGVLNTTIPMLVIQHIAGTISTVVNGELPMHVDLMLKDGRKCLITVETPERVTHTPLA